MKIVIKQATETDIPDWLELRMQLWEPDPDDDFQKEILEIVRSSKQVAFIAYADAEKAGFLEVSIREYADGCRTNHVGYIEGIFVKPELRRRGISRLLIEKAETWFRARGCTEMASDAELDNDISLKMHAAMGFQSLKPIVQFTKVLKS